MHLQKEKAVKQSIKITWKQPPKKGVIEAVYGKVDSVKVFAGNGQCIGNSFTFAGGEGTLEVSIAGAKVEPGAFATIVRVKSNKTSFSFFLRDALHSENPIWIPEYQVAVMPGRCAFSYEEISEAIRKKNIQSDFIRFDNEPEESFENAASGNRQQYAPTWLGISRDMRIFRFGYQEQFGFFGKISSCYLAHKNKLWPSDDLYFAIGQGAACRYEISRWLEEGSLPILRAIQKENIMHYYVTGFASLEKGPLKEEGIRGTHWLAAYANSGGNRLGKQEREEIKHFLEEEMYNREQEVVLCCRVEAVNTGKVPCYAWFKSPYFTIGDDKPGICFDETKGTTLFEDKILSLTLFNGKPIPQREMAVLLAPGEKAVFDIFIPHSPLPLARGDNLARIDFDRHLEAARIYWLKKLETAAIFNLPEQKINEAVKAGLLHCDIVALGQEPDGPVAPHIGWYSPIGTESAPIIQYFDSVGWHKLAERSIQFFFERQQENGFIQNFGGYESETGPVLWVAGEHFRYTGDKKWLIKVMPHIKKAVEYILQWREKNKTEECRKKGFYGMVDGKVADPEDYYHSFFLNAGSYLGLKRIAEITQTIEPEYSAHLTSEVKKYQQDIKNGFYFAMVNAPVVPVGDGSWVPFSPKVEHNGNTILYADNGNWFTHGAFATRGVTIGPLWLVIGEVLSTEEIGSHFLLKHNQFPVTRENAALSQPYYSRHDFAHIKRGEVKLFLKCYYNQLTALMDRETYTFWEHYFGAGQHKTHEEAWFLMQTRWMLYLENGHTISLFSAVPRKWLEDGQTIEVKNASSYFGKISFGVISEIGKNNSCITAYFECKGSRKPEKVFIRIPHPEARKPVKVEGGFYCYDTETVEVKNFKGRCSVKLFY